MKILDKHTEMLYRHDEKLNNIEWGVKKIDKKVDKLLDGFNNRVEICNKKFVSARVFSVALSILTVCLIAVGVVMAAL